MSFFGGESNLLALRLQRSARTNSQLANAEKASPFRENGSGGLVLEAPGAAFHPMLDQIGPNKLDDARIVIAVSQVVVEG